MANTPTTPGERKTETVRNLDGKSVKTHPSCWTAVEWMMCQEAIWHMRWDWAECVCVFVCLWICKYCSHYVMQASEPQQEGLWHVCFQQQISERRESYGDPPTADVNKRAKSRKHWPQTRSHCDLKRCVMDITENMPASLFTNLCAVNARQTWTNRDGDQLKLKPKKKQQRKNRK